MFTRNSVGSAYAFRNDGEGVWAVSTPLQYEYFVILRSAKPTVRAQKRLSEKTLSQVRIDTELGSENRLKLSQRTLEIYAEKT
jgi:hypothetical protein